MKAMVLAAGLGTRLRPLTFELPKPMVPVLDRPVMAHIVDLLDRHGVTDVIANLHYFPDTIRDYFGDRLVYREEPELLGTAGGVRNCADFLDDGTFLIISGDALTDIDLDAFVARHKAAGGIGTLAVKRVHDTREFGVVLHDAEGRITGFQEKPDPVEALSDLGNCGMYLFEPAIFDYFPRSAFVDWANDVFPALLANDVPFHIHEIDEYWNDVGSLDELKAGTFDAMQGALRVELRGEQVAEGVRICEGTQLTDATLIEPPVWIGRDVTIAPGVRLQGPLAIGDGVTIGEGAALKDAVVLPGTEIAPHTILIGAITGSTGIVERLHPRQDA
jgi:mannose-1-phosphate guanylyltransferase/mannose-1-phosphate guanylyltransferase/phosphomannomutase